MSTSTKKKAAGVDFRESADDGVEQNETSTAIAERPGAELVAPSTGGGGIDGEINSSDMQIPRISLVHGVSEVADQQLVNGKAKPGSHVVDQEWVLVDEDGSFEVVVYSATKFFEENLSQEEREERLPQRFASEAEVREHGLSLRWNNETEEPPGAYPALDLVLLVKQPKGVDDVYFPFPIGGESWMLAQMTLRKSGYRIGGKYIITQAGTALRGRDLLSGRFEVRHKKIKAGNNRVSVSEFKLLRDRNGDDFVAEARAVFGV